MLEVQQSIVNDLYATDSHKERVEEDSSNFNGRLLKEVLAHDEYRGRNLFYYAFVVVIMTWKLALIVNRNGYQIIQRN